MIMNIFISLLWEVHIHITIIQIGVLLLTTHASVTLYQVTSTMKSMALFPLIRNRPLESIWTAIPLALIYWLMNLILTSILRRDLLSELSSVSDITAMQWFWSSHGEDIVMNSSLVIGEMQILITNMSLCFPIGASSQIFLSSEDVIHCFTLPSLGVKSDVIPGRINSVLLSSFYQGCFMDNVLSYVELYMGLCLLVCAFIVDKQYF